MSATGAGGSASSISATGTTGAPSSASATTASTGGSGPSGKPFAYVGAADGKIRVMSVDAAARTLSEVQEIAAGQNPSFLAFSPDKHALYAVDEGSSTIEAFSIDPMTGTLTFINSVPSNGSGPAHVAVDLGGKYVFGVNYGSGSFTMVGRRADNGLGTMPFSLSTGVKAHEIVFDPTNHYAFVPNLGSDYVMQLVFDPQAGTIDKNAVPTIGFPAGSGPRHMAFHPSAPFAYVIHETASKMTAMSFDTSSGRLTTIQTVSTLPTGANAATNTGAEVAFGASGQFLYGSNRGDDSIVTFSVDATSGMMTLVGHTKTGGMTPRQFSIDPSGKLLLVGNQGSNEITVFAVDPQTGKLNNPVSTALPASPEFVGVIYLL